MIKIDKKIYAAFTMLRPLSKLGACDDCFRLNQQCKEVFSLMSGDSTAVAVDLAFADDVADIAITAVAILLVS